MDGREVGTGRADGVGDRAASNPGVEEVGDGRTDVPRFDEERVVTVVRIDDVVGSTRR